MPQLNLVRLVRLWRKTMKIDIIQAGDTNIAVVFSEKPVIVDVQSALDLILSVSYQTDVRRIVINKEAMGDEFFILSTGLAGEILQKFINYQVKVAMYGDYSRYTSKPLKDFIYESNRGKNIFFTGTKEEAIDKLKEK